MKVKEFIGVTNKSVVVSIRGKNEKMPKYYGVTTWIPDTLLEYDITSIDIATNTAVLVIDIKENSHED